MAEHVKTIEEVMEWECVWGDCTHDGDCPYREQEVCLDCSDLEENDDGFVTYTSWEYAEQWHHKVPERAAVPGGESNG